MNGSFRIGILALIAVVVISGVISAATSNESASLILGLCTLVCVSLMAILHQSTAIKLDTTSTKLDSVAKETKEQTIAITEVKRQTNGLTKELVRKSEKVAFAAGKEASEEASNGGLDIRVTNAIDSAIGSLNAGGTDALKAHIEKTNQNMEEIKQALVDLKRDRK